MKIKKNKHYVYVLIDPRNSEPFYVGKGINNRVLKHFTDAYTKSYNPTKTNKIRSIQSKGFEVEIQLMYYLTEEEAYGNEQTLIEQYGRINVGTGSLTNLNEGGRGGNMGYKMPPEVIEKLKTRRRGVKTPEGLERIRQAVSGPKTTEHKKKLQNNCPRARPVLQFDVDGSFVIRYISAREAGKQTGIDNVQISRCCLGRYKTAGGFSWQYDD